jgi:AmiR/NasT family two-component response regulator
MIATLQADGILSRDHVAQLEEALISSRSIGAAIGILMASRQVSQDQAFLVLKEASQRSNRKLHDLAAELVASTTTPTG